MLIQFFQHLLKNNDFVSRDLRVLPDLPEFQLSLKPDDYTLPEADSTWDIPGQSLKEHLKECEDGVETV